jgi:glucose dehydrogenase
MRRPRGAARGDSYMGFTALLLAIALAISGCEKAVSSVASTNPAPDNSGDWVRPARDYSSTRFSPLDQINTENVNQLVVKTTFSTGVLHGHERRRLSRIRRLPCGRILPDGSTTLPRT